jgi:transcriptional regulator of acetoin/glycerol metabolism
MRKLLSFRAYRVVINIHPSKDHPHPNKRASVRSSGDKGFFQSRAGLVDNDVPLTSTDKQVQMLRQLAADKDRSVDEICQTLGIGRTTYYRYVKVDHT